MSVNPVQKIGDAKRKRTAYRRLLGIFGPLDRALLALNYQHVRDQFIIKMLAGIPAGSLILDAGAGSQPYRLACSHLEYRSQDFGEFKVDEKKSIFSNSTEDYPCALPDYVGNIWDIDEKPETFDAILCSEVFEHIPYPIETMKEFSRLLKKNGTLIITTPSNSIRHMDPFFFYNGFTDRWYEKFTAENKLNIELLLPVGDYYRHHLLGLIWAAKYHSFFAKLVLFPAMFYLYLKKPTASSVNTLCLGYYLVARKN